MLFYHAYGAHFKTWFETGKRLLQSVLLLPDRANDERLERVVALGSWA
jgi:hypothetical protein